MFRFGLSVLAALTAVSGMADSSHAQGAALPRASDENVSVRGRARPEYDAPGIPAGGFRFYPEMTLSGQYTDNVFATNIGAEEDVVGVVGLAGELRSNWSTHALNLTAETGSRFFADHSDENATDFQLGAEGRLDVDRSFYFFGSGDFGQFQEARSDSPSVLPLAEPVDYTLTSYQVGLVKSYNRLKLSTQARQSLVDYDDGKTPSGGIIEQDDRDRTVTEGGFRADYSVSPDTSIYVAVAGNARDYDLSPPTVAVERGSSGYEALVGAKFDLSRLVRGEVGVGYLAQSYDQSGVDDARGLAVRGKVEWFPDELVTVSISGARDVGDAGVAGAAGYISNSAAVQVDYEFRRNIIFGTGFAYDFDEYDGIDREDARWRADVSVDYAINRGASTFVQASHVTQSSEGSVPGREYDINRVTIGLRLRR